MTICASCGARGPHTRLGPLGAYMWYRCRYCGMDFFREPRPKTEKES